MPAQRPERPTSGISIAIPRVDDPSTQRAFDRLSGTLAQILNGLELFNTVRSGRVPASPGGIDTFLRADGTWSSTSGGGSSSISSPFHFGTGTDGAAVFDGITGVTGCTLAAGVYTMTRHCFWTNAVGSGGAVLKTDGYIYKFNGTLSGVLIIDTSGGDASGSNPGAASATSVTRPLPVGVVGVSGNPSGTGGTATIRVPRSFGTGAGGAGGALGNNAGTPGSQGRGGGGGGGSAGAGGTGGSTTALAATEGDWEDSFSALSGRTLSSVLSSSLTVLSCGSSGGSGGSGGAGDRLGGGSGGAGGWQVGFIHAISGSGIIFRARGGNGGNGATNGTFSGGGGAGGSGGLVALAVGPTVTSLPVPDVAGGAGGLGAVGANSGGNGAAGGAGDFRIYQ